MRNIGFDECDSFDEVCGWLNKIFAKNEQLEKRVDELEALKAKKKAKKKGSISIRTLMALVLLVLAFAGLCYAAYVPTDINYDIASNPETLSVFLRDVLGTMASDSYLFNPRSAAPQATEGRVYYDSDTNAWTGYNGTSWQNFDVAGGVNLNGAYDFGGAGLGKTITATDGAVTIQNTEADSTSLLSLSYTTGAQTGDAITITISGGTADGIEFENTGSGYDMEGTGAVWFMDKSGNLTCVDITTSDDVLLAGTNYDVAFDASRDALVFEDEAILGFGAGTHDDAPDITFIFNTAGSDLDITFDDLEIAFGSDGAGGDVYFYSETASHSALFSEANDELYMTHYDIQLDDNADFIVGSNDDWVIECDGADTLEILTKLTDGTATINLGVDGAGADLKMFPETSGDYVLFDSDADELYFEDCDLKLNEGAQVEFCYTDNATDWTIDLSTALQLLFTPNSTGDDAKFTIGSATNTSDFYLFGATANHTVWWDASAMIFYHGANADGHDVMWYGDTASSYMKWDEDGQTNGALIFEATDIVMMDGDFIKFGDGLDFTIDSSTGKNLDIAPAAASDDYILNIGLDQSGVSVNFFGAAANHVVKWDAANDIWLYGVTGEGMDVKFWGDTASSYMLWDEDLFTNGALVFSAADIQLLDGDGLYFGSAAGTGDFKISDESDVLLIDVVAAGVGSIAIGNDADDVPLKWFGETASSYFQFTGDTFVVAASDILLDATSELYDKVLAGTKVVSGIPVVIEFRPTAAETLAYTVPTGYTLVITDAFGWKIAGAGSGANDDINLQNDDGSAANIFDAEELDSIGDKARFIFDNMDDSENEVASTKLLECVTQEASSVDCIVIVTGYLK